MQYDIGKSKCYEDFEVGQEFITNGRTITETDIVNYSGISGVFHPLHIDKEYCKKTIFKNIISHGPLILSISNGLVSELKLCDYTIVALLQLEWIFKKPVFISDTITAKEVVEEKKEVKDRNMGIIVFKRYIYNQNDEVVQIGKNTVLIKRKTDN